MKKRCPRAVFILKLFICVLSCLFFSCVALSSRAAARSYAACSAAPPSVPSPVPPVSGENAAVDWREEMRNFVIAIAEAARKANPGFELIVQNAQELITLDGVPDSPVMRGYLNAIAGTGREDL